MLQMILYKVVDFYGEFIRGKQPRCEFCYGNGNVDNGLLRVIIALGDIICNPDLIKNYDNTPVLIEDIVSNASFIEVMKDKVTKGISFFFDY